MMKKAWLSLGGNMGDVEAAMQRALQRFDTRDDCAVIKVSSLYKTPPWGKIDQNWFLNACCLIKTTLNPEGLLSLCLELEKEMKRERVEKWGPRTLDIDMLAYEGIGSYHSATLTLPHPFMTQRAFVIVPLYDICADLRIGDKTVAEWSQLLPENDMEMVRSDQNWWKA